MVPIQIHLSQIEETFNLSIFSGDLQYRTSVLQTPMPL